MHGFKADGEASLFASGHHLLYTHVIKYCLRRGRLISFARSGVCQALKAALGASTRPSAQLRAEHLHTHARHTHAQAPMRARTHTHTHTHIHPPIHTHTHTNTHTHTHTHTHTARWQIARKEGLLFWRAQLVRFLLRCISSAPCFPLCIGIRTRRYLPV